jgi:hypothetical protein
MTEAGVGKVPSCSMIEVNGVVLMILVEVPSTYSKKCQARVRSLRRAAETCAQRRRDTVQELRVEVALADA